jgi:hexosaminidase
MKIQLFSVILLLAFSSPAQCPVIPTPVSYAEGNVRIGIANQFEADSTTFVLTNWEFLQQQLMLQMDVTLVHSISDRAFRFITQAPIDMPGTHGEAYSLSLTEVEMKAWAQSDRAQFYALNSLLQLIQKDQTGWYLTECNLQDSPKFSWRGLHLDVSRHFFTVDEVKRYIDLMSLYKLNTFHWHLTDDQGWRIEIKQYPKLTTVGAYRDSTVIGHYSDSPRHYDHSTYGGYYSQEDVVEIVNYAKRKYITVVPEIEMPGHSRAALAAYPELSCTGIEQGSPGLWGVFDDIYCSKDASIQFMKNVLAEVLELFPSTYIHIGGDEAPKTRWKQCANCQKVIAENGLKDEHELQSYFILQMDEYLSAKGRKLIGWDEILEGGLSPNAAVMSWRGTEGGIEAAKQKHEVVMTPTTYCYFDYYQSSHPSEPLAIGGYLPLEKVYAFNPIPEDLPANLEQYILGGQANLWTEYIPTMKQLEYMTYPRALALAQAVWCNEKPSYEAFLETYLKYQENYLERHGVNTAKSVHFPVLEIARAKQGVNVHFKGAGTNYGYTVSTKHLGGNTMSGGLAMGPKDSLYFERVANEPTKKIKTTVLTEDGSEPLTQLFLLHSALGLPIEMITKPHPKFDHNGSLTLVDGVIGVRPWKGSEWLGFTDEKIEFIVDLEQLQTIGSLQLGFLEDNGSWIYLPTKVEVSISKDNSWKRCQKKIVADVTEENFKLPINKRGRFIRVSISSMKVIPDGLDGGGHEPWTFIDELQLIMRP